MGTLTESGEIKIYEVRGCRVILQDDLARIYGVSARRLSEQVRRNPERFPADFMIRLTMEEAATLVPQIAAPKKAHGGHRIPPLAFTQEGAAMLSSVLRSPRAVQANIAIMRAFVKMRALRAENRVILEKLDQLEKRVDKHDGEIGKLIDAIRQDVLPPNRKEIGFREDLAK